MNIEDVLMEMYYIHHEVNLHTLYFNESPKIIILNEKIFKNIIQHIKDKTTISVENTKDVKLFGIKTISSKEVDKILIL